MIKIENVEVTGITRAIYSARNAMNSWDKSDSDFGTDTLGENDYKLAMKLAKAGTDHRKFMRMINVTVDITAPLYWISELDTYKVGTVRNSCSFMHKGVSKPFEITDFSTHNDEQSFYSFSNWDIIIEILNFYRNEYLKTKDDNIFQQLRCLLPCGYNLRFTIQLNYEVLANIYRSRRNHRLDEWRTFCSWIETLPYSKLITECQTKANDIKDKDDVVKLFNKMRECKLFNGIYDARGKDSEDYMYGISAVMEYIAYEISDKCGDEFSATFINNMIESERRAELTKKAKKKKGWWRR